MNKILLWALILITNLSACGQNRKNTEETGNDVVVVDTVSLAPKKVAILGDSYSTFEGYIPEGFISWYKRVPKKGRATDVTEVEQTWWDIFLKEHDYILETNNSYSGSTICNTGYAGNDYSDRSFISRVGQLGNPDIILVYGGTNDSWANSPIGDFVYENWTPKHLYSFRPATSYLLNELKKNYPDADIRFMINGPEITKDVIINSIQEICNHYSVPYIMITGIEKMTDHPDQKGMRQIVEQLDSALSSGENPLF